MDFQQRIVALGAQGSEGVVDLVDATLAEGLRRRASDIHLDPVEGGLAVRFRLDGVLRPVCIVPTPAARNAIARVKVLAGLLTYQTELPQEGRIDRAKVGASSDLRVATFPTVLGEKAVVRLVDAAERDLDLGDLGYPPDALGALERGLAAPQGSILFTGPSGSGKTTTIYASLRAILGAAGGARHVVSIEDPVERVVPGATQTQVKPAVGLTFARCLRSLLRQDPEVIVVGEIRDRETAAIAIEAGLTGHLVISTIHSGRAAGVFARLLEMDVEPTMLASSVSLVVAQRLLRVLCPVCAAPATGTEGECQPAEAAAARQAVGCDQCFGTGYRGRTAIVEHIVPGRELRGLVLARGANEEMEEAARRQGMKTLRERALEAVAEGITSLDEVNRTLGREE